MLATNPNVCPGGGMNNASAPGVGARWVSAPNREMGLHLTYRDRAPDGLSPAVQEARPTAENSCGSLHAPHSKPPETADRLRLQRRAHGSPAHRHLERALRRHF